MKKPKDYIIFPLDVPTIKEAAKYIDLLSEEVGMFKVGLELFIEAGPEIIRIIKDAGSAEIFLDLKLHDIPVTVSRAMNRISRLGVKFATVHCGETVRMLEAAVKGSEGNVGILAVTLLTSVNSADIHASGYKEKFSRDLTTLVLDRALMAKEAGCTGVVCSGQEVKSLKASLGSNFKAITPGIRPSWDVSGDDQRRIVTPGKAIEDGSDYLVIGRPIRDSADPVSAAKQIADEINMAVSDKKPEQR